jgi:hypothetical protein
VGKAIYAIDAFPDDAQLWRIDWIGGVAYNASVPSEPLIDVCLAPLGVFRVSRVNPWSQRIVPEVNVVDHDTVFFPLKYPSDLQDSTTLTAKLLTRSEGTIGELKTLLAAAATEAMRSGTERFVYGRTGVKTASPLPPEARYTLWRHDESKQRSSALLQAGSWQPTWNYDASSTDGIPPETTPTAITHAYKLDYSTAVVDPVDDTTFWVIHEYADGAKSNWVTVILVLWIRRRADGATRGEFESMWNAANEALRTRKASSLGRTTRYGLFGVTISLGGSGGSTLRYRGW